MVDQDFLDQMYQWSARGFGGLLDLWEQWIAKNHIPVSGDAQDALKKVLLRAEQLRKDFFPQQGD